MELIFRNNKTHSRIINESDGTRLFEKYCGDGQYIKFNVDYIDEGHYEWFCNIVGKQIDYALNHREMKTKEKIQDSFKKLLNL